MAEGWRYWLWELVFRLWLACGRALDAVFGVLGIGYPTLATGMALLTVVMAVSLCLMGMFLLARAAAVELGGAGTCKHGVAVGRHKFCARCAMEANAAGEIEARLREQRADRMRAERAARE